MCPIQNAIIYHRKLCVFWNAIISFLRIFMTKCHTQNSNYAIELIDPTVIVLLIDKYFIVLFWLHNMHKSTILHLQESCFEYMGENWRLLRQELYCWILNPLWKSDNQPIVEIRWSQDCLIPSMIFPILVRWHLYIESGSRYLDLCYSVQVDGLVLEHPYLQQLWTLTWTRIFFLRAYGSQRESRIINSQRTLKEIFVTFQSALWLLMA